MTTNKKKALLWLIIPFAALVIIVMVFASLSMAQSYGADQDAGYGSMDGGSMQY